MRFEKRHSLQMKKKSSEKGSKLFKQGQ